VGQSSIPVDFWIQDILIDYEGTVWLALFGDGIYRYGGSHIKSGGVIHPDLTQSLNWLYVDRVGKAWTGTSEYLYSIAGDRVDRYKGRHLLGGIEQRPDGRYYVVSESAVFGPEAYEDVGARSSFVASIPNWPSGMHAVGKDSLWVSSYGGGATLIVSGTIRKTYSKQDGLASNMIDRLIPTQSGLWFLSRGEGMSRITTDSVSTQTTADDLPSNVTYTLFEDADGTLWTGTDKGIARRNGGRWRTYTSNGLLMGERTHVIFRKSNAPDGPLYALSGRHLYLFDESDNDFHRLGSFIVLVNEDASINQAVYHGLSSVLYLATTKGFESINIDNPVGRPTPPKTAITALRFGDVILEPGDDTIRVPYTENNIFIDFAVLSFTNENATTVEYRLGSSAEWINAPSVRTVSLLDVADGRHEFQLRAYSADGIPSNTSMSVMFEVVPPFWRTTWFRLVAILILLIATATGIRYLLARRLDERVRELSIIEHVQFERTRISRDIHDNVGAQVSNLIAGIELTKMNVLHRGTETIGEQLDVLEDDARLTMAQLRETIWALKQNEISLGDFSQQLTRFMLRQTAYGGPTPSPIKIVGDEQFVLSPERALELYRIAQEAISNAVRHSGGSTLSVMLESADESVVMLIEDDGDFTVQKKDEFGGNGIPNMRRRAQNLNGLFSIETTDGTSIRIEIPRRPA
jgi:signal transduction histidine kinase